MPLEEKKKHREAAFRAWATIKKKKRAKAIQNTHKLDKFIRPTEIKKIKQDLYKEKYARDTIDDVTASEHIRKKQFKTPSLLFPVRNGLIDISKFPVTLIPHSPKYYYVSTLPYNYDPETKCPIFEKYLKEVLPNEMDRLRLQEHMGYLLYGKNPFEIAVLLTGPEDSGKSTFMRIIELVLGKDNIVHIPLQELTTDRFAAARLVGKFACLFADLPSISIRTSGMIKALISGDGISVQDKFKIRHEADLRAKFWFSANTIPFTYDTENPFFKRWDIFTFPNQFPLGSPQRDNFLIDKIKEERSGILNWMLEGLERLLMNKKFIEIKSIEERREIWLLGSSSLYKYVKTCVEVNKDLFVTKMDFYEFYVEWCAKNNLPILSTKTVGSQLPRLIPSVRTFYPKIGKKQVLAWKGINIVRD